MSFQGDVRGIGLAELLQGLARGRKEGVLTLTAKNAPFTTLGIRNGELHLLPDPSEDPELWRNRVRDAWAKEQEFRIDYLRMSEIAKAQRLEDLYLVLDGDDIHFRFDPGPLPKPEDADARRPLAGEHEPKIEVFCEPIGVEYLLLEYARLSDHLENARQIGELLPEEVPVILDPGAAADPGLVRLFPECTGDSTLQEIADRLGWPLRQAQTTIAHELIKGTLRIADPSEMLALAVQELNLKNFSRAAARFNAWCTVGRCGPVSPGELDALATEWLSGRLPAALKVMPPKRMRTLLRRMDHAAGNATTAVVHWHQALRIHPGDRITRLHRLACEFRDEGNPQTPDLRELMELTRDLRDAGNPKRNRPALVMAAHRQPKGVNQQLELGLGLVSAGLGSEGSPWILAASEELLEGNNADRAIGPLRTLLEADPRNRSCKALLSRAKRESTYVRKLRKNMFIALSVIVVITAGAVVKVRAEKNRSERMHEVAELMGNPVAAVARLDEYFGDDETPEVQKLREEIEENQRVSEIVRQKTWTDLYVAAQEQCSVGDPILGLRSALDLPEPPVLELIETQWPLRNVLFNTIGEQLQQSLDDFGPAREDAADQKRGERSLVAQVMELRKMLSEVESAEDIEELVLTLDGIEALVAERQETREELMAARLQKEAMNADDAKLAAAREHARHGDFARSLRNYDDLLTSDSDGSYREVLADEIDEIRSSMSAVNRARELCAEGDHESAFELLDQKIPNFSRDIVLPWRVETSPPGAQVRLSVGGSRITPFQIETTRSERTQLKIQLAGFDPVNLEVRFPANQFLILSRTTERKWRGKGRIDAPPVAVGSDHILVDRKGRVARIGGGDKVIWEKPVQTLSGIARAPVFLPERPGHLLLVTEDGQAWILSASNGNLEGPWDLGSTPVAGPYPTDEEVCVRLQDGRLAVWDSRVKPTYPGRATPEFDGANLWGNDAGMSLLRRKEGLTTQLDCPWTDWRAIVKKDAYHVFRVSEPENGYNVAREGAWEFIGWEAPSKSAEAGRLWISDDHGVRAFVP